MHCGTRFPSCSAPAGHAGRPAGVPSRMITQVPAVAGTLPGTIPTRFEGTFRLLVETERLLSQADTTRENNFISSSDNKELPALSATPPLTAYDQRTLRSRQVFEICGMVVCAPCWAPFSTTGVDIILPIALPQVQDHCSMQFGTQQARSRRLAPAWPFRAHPSGTGCPRWHVVPLDCRPACPGRTGGQLEHRQLA
jgi:hypothetical protein